MTITDRGMQARPAEADQWLRRSLGRGCGVLEGRITPYGARLFYFRYTDSTGGRVRLLIGPYSSRGAPGAFTLDEANRRAHDWSLLYQAGARDLREHLGQQREDAERAAAAERQRMEAEADAAALAADRKRTVRQLFADWKRTELAPHTRADGKRVGRKDGGAEIERLFVSRVFPAIGDTLAPDVRKADAMAILDAARADGKLRTANVLLASMRQMFRFGLVREVVDRNPLETVTRRDAGGAETMRDRALSADEIKALARALPRANLTERSALAVWLILATGVRVSECMGARWEHVDLAASTWYLPETKNGRDHTIHLSAFALEQFRALERLRKKDADGKPSAWVFSNTAATAPTDIRTFGKQLADRQRGTAHKNRTAAASALVLAGGRWTPHDLRRTAATLMAELGVSGDVIDECLNHQIESRVRRVYIRDRRLPEQARAFDALGARLAALSRITK